MTRWHMTVAIEPRGGGVKLFGMRVSVVRENPDEACAAAGGAVALRWPGSRLVSVTACRAGDELRPRRRAR